jgi:hypothetical protein
MTMQIDYNIPFVHCGSPIDYEYNCFRKISHYQRLVVLIPSVNR